MVRLVSACQPGLRVAVRIVRSIVDHCAIANGLGVRCPTCKAPRHADEVDAIGKARGLGGGDSGTAEREQGLLQLLCEMDGFRQNDRVLVIGATNMCAVNEDQGSGR